MIKFDNHAFKDFIVKTILRTADTLRKERNPECPVRLLDPYYWLLAILRVRTIFLEKCECNGIKLDLNENGEPIKPVDFSTDMNYYDYFLSKLTHPSKLDSLLDAIYKQLIDDTSPLALCKRRIRLARNQAIQVDDRFQETLGLFSQIFGLEPCTATRNMVFEMLKFDLIERGPARWVDVRVSRKFIRDAARHFTAWHEVDYTRNISMAGMTFDNYLLDPFRFRKFDQKTYVQSWNILPHCQPVKVCEKENRFVDLIEYLREVQEAIITWHINKIKAVCKASDPKMKWSNALSQLRMTDKFICPRTLCFQTLILNPFGLALIQPRRVAIYYTKELPKHTASQPKTEQVLYGFCYYQYFELYRSNVGRKYTSNYFGNQSRHACGYQSQYYQHQIYDCNSVYEKYYENPYRNGQHHRGPDFSYIKEFLSDKSRDKGNFNKYDCFLPQVALLDLPPAIRETTAFNVDNCLQFGSNNVFGKIKTVYYPKMFTDKVMEVEIAAKFKRNPALQGEFCYEDEGKIQWDKYLKADDKLLDLVSDEKGAQQLLRLIKAIPKIKFKLTPEQELMISTPQNILCLGRSGTGKTTSSALRLFATDASFKYKEQYKKHMHDHAGQPFKVNPYFMNESSKLKLLFISASPVLVNEVKRFYIDFKAHFGTELEKYQAKKELENAEIEIINTSSMELGVSQEISLEDQEKEELRKYIENEIRSLEDEETIEKQKHLGRSMDELSNEDFPLFLTVKRLLYMLDATTTYPFFARNNEGKQISMDSGVEWHNEAGGVFMINQYYKGGQGYENALKDLGQKILEIQGNFEEEDDEDESPVKSASVRYDAANVFKGLVNVKDAKGLSIQSRNLSFEVDFEIFKTRFFPKVVTMTKLNPLVVWTEIYSEIKGRIDSYKYEFGGIPASQYIQYRRKKASGFLTVDERVQVYKIFVRYEQWKLEQGSYDLNDLVNHILDQLKRDYFKKETRNVHFLMVDEVQDLTQNVISLLISLAEQNIFFSGDTAQTIAKGVGFRFYDLKKVFERYDYENSNYSTRQIKPKVLQLCKNFRSHSKILDLANSVVSLLELLFPKTIDKLKKETSDSDGPKPIIINQSNEKLLESLFNQYKIWGGQFKDDAPTQEDTAKQQFGCDRVVIVRDQESKAKVPEFMKEMLILTVYECKGLEFDEVILFNFFQDSKCDLQWKLLNDVKAIIKMTPIANIGTDFMDFDNLEVPETEQEATTNFHLETEEEKSQIQTNKLEDENEMSIHLQLLTSFPEVYRKFAHVCTELKLLYVAITRPKNLLIIYDQEQFFREPIQRYWEAVRTVNVVTREMQENHDLIPQQIKKAFMISEGPGSNEEAQRSLLKWRLQGFRLFKAKFYQAAMQCFKNSGDQELTVRCLAYEYADKGSALKGQSDEKFSRSRDRSTPKRDRPVLKKEAKELLAESQAKLSEAGRLFAEINMNKHAAQCFFTARNAISAADLFLKMGKFGQAAESFYKTGNVKKAAGLYARAELFANAFECYERLEDWDGLILCLNKYKDKFSESERQSYVEKYFPIALNSLYQLFTNLDPEGSSALAGINEENKGKIQQMRLKLKFAKSVSMIKEEEQETEEEDSMEEEEVQEAQEETKDLIGQIKTEDKPQVDQEELIDTSSKPKPRIQEETKDHRPRLVVEEETKDWLEESKDQSYEVIKDLPEQSFEDLVDDKQVEASYEVIKDSSLRQLELDLLSNIDPDDEFLQSNKSFSLIEQVSCNDSSYSVVSAQSAGQFSVIAGSEVHSILKSIVSMNQSKLNQSNLDSTISLSESIKADVAENQNALSDLLSRCSVIKGDGMHIDQYAEDIVMQKVIYYVSLFSTEVKEQLNSMRSKDFLSQVLADQSKEDQFNLAADGDQIYEDNLEYMLIDLDNLNPDVLGLVLDTLEYYELFRLCLIVGNRYKMTEKNGRYVAAICQKYSNLSQFRITAYEKFRVFGAKAAQLKYASLAQEAMNNVLALACQSKTSQDVVWRQSCFDSMFLNGFWKKLIFILDADSSLQLSYAVKDSTGFKLSYLVHKLALTDPSVISEALSDDKSFAKLLKDKVQDGSYFLAKQLLEFESTNLIATQYINEKHNPEFFRLLSSEHVGPKQVRILSQIIASQKKSTCRPSKFYQKSDKIIEICLTVLKTLVESKLDGKHHRMIRAIYEPWGISTLDGLDLFDNFSQNYVLLSESRSTISHEVQIRQDALLYIAKVKLIRDLVPRMKAEGLNQNQMAEEIKRQMNDFAKTIEQSKEVAGMQLALAADIELDFYLLPKAWAFEVITVAFAQFCLVLIQSESQQPFKVSKQLYQLQHLTNRLAPHLRPRLGRIRDGIFSSQNGTMIKTLSEQIVGTQIFLKRDSLDELRLNINNQLQMVKSRIEKSISSTIITDFIIQRKPSFSLFTTSANIQGRHKILDFAYRLATNALAKELMSDNKQFCRDMLTAVQAFISCNSYMIMSELLTTHKQAIAARKTTSVKVDAVWHLLDAHVFAKVNDFETSTKFLLKYLQLTNSTIQTAQIVEIVETAIYQGLLSLCIQTYKETHGGVSMPTQKYSQYIEHGMPVSQTVTLQSLWCKPATLRQVQTALAWMASVCKSVNDSDVADAYFDVFESALIMVQTCCKNLFSEQVFELKESMSEIFAAVAYGKLDVVFKKYSSQMRDFDQIKYAKNNKEVKKYCLLIKSIKLSTTYVTVQVADRKKQKQLASDRLANISTATKEAGTLEKQNLAARKKAAAKISGAWKRMKLNKLKKPEQRITREATGDSDFEVASILCPAASNALQACELLAAKLTNIMGSTLVQNSLDLQYILDKLRLLASRRLALREQVKDVQRNPEQFESLVESAGKLSTIVADTSTKLTEWLDKRNEQRSMVEQEREKKRYLKTEKWNSVISFHKKKRVLLRHLKKY